MKNIGILVIATVLLVLAAQSILPIIGKYDYPKFLSYISAKEKENSWIMTLDLNQYSKLLTVGHEDGTVDIYDTYTDDNVIKVNAHETKVYHVTASNKGDLVASSPYFSEETRLWNTKTGEMVLELPSTRGPEIFSLDSNYLFLADSDEVVIYDLVDKHFFPSRYETQTSNMIEVMRISPNGEYLAIGTTSGVELCRIINGHKNISLLSWSQDQKNIELEFLASLELGTSSDWTQLVAFSSNNKQLITASRFGGVDVLDIPSFNNRKHINTQLGHINSASYMEWAQSIYLLGTKEKVGVGQGFAEIVHLKSGESKIIGSKFSFNALAVLFTEPQMALIANYKKYYVQKLNKYK